MMYFPKVGSQSTAVMSGKFTVYFCMPQRKFSQKTIVKLKSEFSVNFEIPEFPAG